ncbi:hypothetical protein NC653_001857 [Populus alba x Populus x berolinensis]|uniref:Transmembrane protein n=1 Tax=Populus alba x Populus x berolinensis TaxID=444605 RepID=A0AAD6WG14_9ROSI|nr:hypothetical protein NC653_001857 [Populus alba x Populus x berolinensis]
MGLGLAWLGFLDLTWVLQDLGPLIFYNRWVLHDLVLNKCGCTRLPAGCVGGYCSGSVGLDVFGLWEIRWFVLCSGLVSSLSFRGAGCVYSGIQNLHSSIVKGCWWLFKLIFFVAVGDLGLFVWWEIATVVVVFQLEKNFVLARFVACCLILFWVEENNSVAFYFKGFYWVDWSLLMLCFFCACFAAGYWIFVPIILFHFIGLVTAAVLGFVRVPMLSRLVVYGLSMSFSLLVACDWWLNCCFEVDCMHVISIGVELSLGCRELKHYNFPVSLQL